MSDGDERDERSERIAHHRWLCARAGKLLGAPADHTRSVIQGSLDFAFETMINGMVETGRLPNEISAFIRLAELQMQSAPPMRPPPVITVIFTDSTDSGGPASSSPSSDARTPLTDETPVSSSGNGSTPPSSEAPSTDDSDSQREFPGATIGKSAAPPPPPSVPYETPGTMRGDGTYAPPPPNADGTAPRIDHTAQFGGWTKAGGDQSWRHQAGVERPNFEAAHQLPMVVLK